jgi:hypothetical protein
VFEQDSTDRSDHRGRHHRPRERRERARREPGAADGLSRTGRERLAASGPHAERLEILAGPVKTVAAEAAEQLLRAMTDGQRAQHTAKRWRGEFHPEFYRTASAQTAVKIRLRRAPSSASAAAGMTEYCTALYARSHKAAHRVDSIDVGYQPSVRR